MGDLVKKDDLRPEYDTETDMVWLVDGGGDRWVGLRRNMIIQMLSTLPPELPNGWGDAPVDNWDVDESYHGASE